MDYKIKILKSADKYLFDINGFLSTKHASLCPEIKQRYNTAWDAYKDAYKIVSKYSYHIDTIHFNKIADRVVDEDYSNVYTSDISADSQISSHYAELISSFEERANGVQTSKDENSVEKDGKILYGEIKMVTGELLKIKDQVKDEREKKKIGELKHRLKQIVHKYAFLRKFLFEDAEKEKKSKESQVSEQPSATDPSNPSAPPNPANPAASPAQAPSLSGLVPQAFNKGSIIRLASSFKINKNQEKEIIDSYCDSICNKLSKRDDSIIGIVKDRSIFLKNEKGTFLKIDIGNNMMIDNIIPVENNVLKSNSLHFYQKYWKPIVEAIGHYHFKNGEEDDYILVSHNLPDIPKKCPYDEKIDAWNCKKKTDDSIGIYFVTVKSTNSDTWQIKPISSTEKQAKAINKILVSQEHSKYTEEDYFKDGSGAMVICDDPNLDIVYKKIGQVLKIYPLELGIIAEIDFGNGSIIRLKEDKFKIIDVDNPPQLDNKITRKKDEI